MPVSPTPSPVVRTPFPRCFWQGFLGSFVVGESRIHDSGKTYKENGGWDQRLRLEARMGVEGKWD